MVNKMKKYTENEIKYIKDNYNKSKIKNIVQKNISEFSRIYNLNHSHIASCLRENRKSHKGWIFNYE